MKTRGLLLATLAFTACATTANYERLLQSWVGHSIDQLAVQWGHPTRSYRLSDGSLVLEYVHESNVHVPGYTQTVPQTTRQSGSVSVYGTGGSARGRYSSTSTTYVQQTTPARDIHVHCTTRFVIDQRGAIVSWAWQGNGCRR